MAEGDRPPGSEPGAAAAASAGSDPRGAALAAIARAQASLEQSVAELEKLPALDAGALGLTAHALNNFLTVSLGVVELLQDRWPTRSVSS